MDEKCGELTTSMMAKRSEASNDDGGGDGGTPEMMNGEVGSLSDMTSETESGVKIPKREKWSRKIDFLLACIGFSVGLGNVWRFPYLCYKNGGGAFLIPYFICVALGGVPMFFLEVAIGQFMSVGGIGVWNLCPLFKGIGFATTIIVFLLNIYYNVILAWAFYYLFSSFTTVLPWSHCNNIWNTDRCRRSNRDIVILNESWANETLSPNSYKTDIVSALTNTSSLILDQTYNGTNVTGDEYFVDPATEYWERKVLQISDGIDEMGKLKWDLALCLLLAWIVVYTCIWKGIKSSGKVMYFTATSPYILMTILLIRGVTLPGAIDGIKFYVIPDWKKLADTKVWVDAGTQIFFSYSISLGALTALGSFNKWNHNCWRDALIFACTNSGTSFFSGFVIFSVLGFMAHEHGVDVSKVAESGPGLAFIAYPKAVSEMPIAPLWSVLFFLMIILLGLDSQFVGVEGFITAIVDVFPRQLRKGHRKELFIAIVCLISFFIGLSMVAKGGMYVFQLFDYYSGSRIILVVAFFECAAVAWIYGINRIYDNLEMMLGYRVNPYIKISWMFTTPLFTLVIFGMCIYSYSELTYNRTYHYPIWAISIGWILACSSVIMIPLTVFGQLAMESGSFTQRIRKLIRPRLQAHQMRPNDDPKDLVGCPGIIDSSMVCGMKQAGGTTVLLNEEIKKTSV